ncbi:UNVERIFIED_CONTAM: type I methionyl aminopeptidase [Euhalothece sp. KZN 001]
MNFLTQLLSPKTSQTTTKTAPQRKRHRGIEIKNTQEIELMRESGRIVATVLKEISQIAAPGMTTMELDAYAEKRIREMGATPSFKGYHGFPGSICVCLNDEVVHGIPNAKKVIRNGDLLKVDTGAYKNGFHGDSCITIAVGKVKPKALELMAVAENGMYEGVKQVKAGNSLLDIAAAIEDYVTSKGYSIVEGFTGHGVGRNLHEAPAVFNTRTEQLPNVKLKAGMVLAIEPIINAGSKFTRTLRDRWTVVTIDKCLSAQFEHTVLVTKEGYEILTDRAQVEN